MKNIFTYLMILTSFSLQAQSTFIQADDSHIQYMGRIDFSNPKAPTYSFPGVTIRVKFNGSQLVAVIKDYASGGSQTTNYYNVVIDNVLSHKLQVNNSDTLYTCASGLSYGPHTVELVKRTESSVGKSSFKGVVIEESALLTLPALPSYKIEFIGDSWTCGYGNEISTNSPNTGFHSVYEDNYRAWGYTVAKKFNAQYHATAISGRGMYRNNSGTTTGVIPDEYERLFAGQSAPLWNFNNYVPDLIIIHLGTNDWYPETLTIPNMLDSASYVNKYITFIDSLRSYYGSTPRIICAFGNSKSDYWPVGLNHLTRWRNYLNAVVNHFTGLGDNLVHKFELSVQNAPYGEDWHPTIATHNQMANEMAAYIQTLTGMSPSSYTAPTNAFTAVNGKVQSSKHMSLYPNPVATAFTLDGLEAYGFWEIYDEYGSLRQTGSGQEGSVSELAPGLYFIKANGRVIKFIKE